jgi:hypothetical protein
LFFFVPDEQPGGLACDCDLSAVAAYRFARAVLTSAPGGKAERVEALLLESG